MASGLSTPTVSPAKGLATLALLKANFDSGRDHIEMFQPFLLDAVYSRQEEDFAAEDIRGEIESRHALHIPIATLRTLLSRATKRGAVRREGGRYFRIPGARPVQNISAARAEIERDQAKLADALAAFGKEHGVNLSTTEDALALLLDFLAKNHVALLLDIDPQFADLTLIAATGRSFGSTEGRLVARFIVERCAKDPALVGQLQRMLEGFILQNALFLRDIGQATRRFTDLTVFLDTGYVLEVLGLKGDAAGLAARESLDILRDTGAQVAVFDKTLHEIRRILRVYEVKLGTADGIASLFQTDLTRYVLRRRFSPSDIREQVALLESNVKGLGVSIRALPERQAKYTLDEAALTKKLKRPYESDLDPRVVHDVDCIAAILTLRAGHRTNLLDDARAVFATTTGLVVKHCREWYVECREPGVPPVLHQLAISNIAWLKKPASAVRLKLHELMALCAAAMAPSRKSWDRFLLHLRNLRDSGKITSDEMVAVVASEITESVLWRFEDDVDVDASTVSEVVERVRDRYRTEAEGALAKQREDLSRALEAHEQARTHAEAEVERQREQLRKVLLRQRALSTSVAKWASWILFFVAGAVLIVPSTVWAPTLFGAESSSSRVVTYLIGSFVWLAGVAGLLWGGYLDQWRRSFEVRVETWIRMAIVGEDWVESTSGDGGTKVF